MITKGTNEYKKAQELANNLLNDASKSRKGDSSYFDIAYEKVGRMLFKVKELNEFASNIATTVEKTMTPYGSVVARMSSKQAWIIACAAIENNIEY
jgi:hypothetical protein